MRRCDHHDTAAISAAPPASTNHCACPSTARATPPRLTAAAADAAPTALRRAPFEFFAQSACFMSSFCSARIALLRRSPTLQEAHERYLYPNLVHTRRMPDLPPPGVSPIAGSGSAPPRHEVTGEPAQDDRPISAPRAFQSPGVQIAGLPITEVGGRFRRQLGARLVATTPQPWREVTSRSRRARSVPVAPENDGESRSRAVSRRAPERARDLRLWPLSPGQQVGTK